MTQQQPQAVPNKTIVSPDTIAERTAVTTDSGRVIFIPMPEWKQCAQRGVRSFIQAFTFFMGGGTVYLTLMMNGVSPDMISGFPTFGNGLVDAAVYSLAFAVLVFCWNFIEFWLDIDVKFPQWRA